jgi:DNA-binding NtrC family response regulator
MALNSSFTSLPDAPLGNQPSPEVLKAKQRFGIVGNAPALLAAVQRAVRVAPIDLSVLVTGESGSGKEFFPQIIHNYSSRKHAKYIAVNCGAIPEGTIDSELFGHEKGSFTGAVASRKGYFEEADGGTIFLDEVAELPMTTQARLLRVLETGEFLKVGSSQVQKTNIRVVAATNVDLPQAIAEGRFREDLYYRLSTVQIVVPPLRDRGNDIMLLTRKFAGDFAERYRMPEIAFSDDARSALLRYRWPGNVRQLKNVIEQVALFEPGTQVSAAVLAEYIPAGAASYTPTRQGSSADHTYEREREMLFNLIFNLRTRIDELTARVEGTPATPDITPTVEVETSITDRNMPVLSPLHTTYATSVNDAERQNIIDALRRNDGRRKATAQELNISERTLYRKIREYGLE